MIASTAAWRENLNEPDHLTTGLLEPVLPCLVSPNFLIPFGKEIELGKMGIWPVGRSH